MSAASSIRTCGCPSANGFALNAAQPMTATKTPPSTLKFPAVPNVLVERQERIRLGRAGLLAHRTRKPPASAGGSSQHLGGFQDSPPYANISFTFLVCLSRTGVLSPPRLPVMPPGSPSRTGVPPHSSCTRSFRGVSLRMCPNTVSSTCRDNDPNSNLPSCQAA